jgi:hypothetical protein
MGLEGLVSKRRDRPCREALDQGEEQSAPADGAGDGSVRVTRPQKIT